MAITYDVFLPGGEYGWLSQGRVQSAEMAAQVAGMAMQLRGVTVHSYEDKEPLGRPRSIDVQGAHERMVIRGTRCMSDAVSTHDGWVNDVRIFGYFPA